MASNRHLNRARSVRGRDTGRDTLGRFNGYGEISAERSAVTTGHEGQAELLATFLGQGQANQATAKARHEIDGLGGDELCRQHQIAFVLAVLFVDQNDHATRAQLGDDFLCTG